MSRTASLATIAKSKAAANRAAKALSIEELTAAVGHLQAALKTAKTREATKQAKQRAANIKKLTAMMAEMGLSASDVAGARGRSGAAKKKSAATKSKAGRKKVAAKATKKTRTAAKSTAGKRGPKKGIKVAAKYALKVKGETHRWTGRGRMPLVFKTYVEKGGSLEKCLL